MSAVLDRTRIAERMPTITRTIVTLALASVIQACVTPSVIPESPKEIGEGGYFVALAAESGSEQTLALYDGLHDAVDGHNRRLAEREGRLADYVKAFESDGYTRLADGSNEIECDPSKCLVKLVARSISAPAADKTALAASLTQAFIDKGLFPVRAGVGEAQTRTYTLGSKDGLHIACVQKGIGSQATYRCDFDLVAASSSPSAAEAALAPVTRGKLVSCAQSPGTVRSAEEAKAELDQGELIALMAPATDAGNPVGFLRIAKQGRGVEFVDLFLCGELSHVRFSVDGAAKAPKSWIPAAAKVGAEVKSIESLRDDEARLVASAVVASETSDVYLLEVRFRVDREAGGSAEVYGEDRFLLEVRKAWVN